MEDIETLVTEHDGRLLARVEAADRVFEVNCDELEATDVTLRLYRGGEQVGSIYNDFGTDKTMARLTVPGSDVGDFIGIEVPKAFVAELLEAAVETGRVRDETAVEGYRLRVL
jgi:adenylate cyclase class IV